MANIKSAKKRVLTAQRNHDRNVSVKSEIKTAIKKTLRFAQEGSSDLEKSLSHVYSLCDKAVSKGVYHKNTVARKKSRLTLAVKKLQAK